MDISMLPTIPSEHELNEVSIAGVRFAGPNQTDLGEFFVMVLNGVATYGDHQFPTMGDLDIGPHHIIDGLVRDYALLPEELTATSAPMAVCCAREVLPPCEACGEPARYDIWATAWQEPQLLCVSCAAPLEGQELGTGSATYIFTLDDIPSYRAWCDLVTTELSRPSIWEASTISPDIR